MRIVVSDESSGSKKNQNTARSCRYGGILLTLLVVLERLLEVGEIPLLVCACDRAHTLDISQLRVLRRKLDGEQ